MNHSSRGFSYDSPKKESGFTLVELVTVMGIIGLLAATSLESFEVLRQSIYNSMTSQTLHESRTALEDGKTEHLESVNEFFSVWSNWDGTLQAWGPDGVASPDDIVPGLRVSSDMRVSIWYDTWCNDQAASEWGCQQGSPCCITESYMVRHCKGKTTKQYHVWNNGQVTEWEWENWGC